MNIPRRRLLQLGVAAAAAPLLAGCGDNDFTVAPDTRFPQGPFGAQSTAEQVTAGVDLAGKVAVVTGCTSGLGLETLRVLALRGAHVVGTGRTLTKAQQACDSVEGITTPLAMELADFDSVSDCAAQIISLGLVPDILICNAGINTFGELELVDGMEKMFRVNFLGHFVFVNHLLIPMLEANTGRIVHVSSQSAYQRAPAEGIDFDNLRGEKAFDAQQAYGQSKLANALFSLELARRLEGTAVTSNALHPGLVQTQIARTAPAPLRKAFDWFGGAVAKSPQQGAATQVYMASSPLLEGVSGAYFEDCNPVLVSGSHHLYDAAMARELLRQAESMTADNLLL
tara:strand:- start:203736 stop:204758 length:1023 start_codon:yes stop_codon:yes gene_type:complete